MPSEALQEFFQTHPSVALGFSGGVDSSYLLYAGLRCGADIKPYFVKTAFQPSFELTDAERICQQLQVPLTIICAEVLCDPAIASNPPDRCYHCKKIIFSALQECATADGYTVLIDGTNASDDAGDRPGMRALGELCVLSPLRMCGLSKDEIRARSRAAGLFTGDKPAYACLATRIPTGMAITQEWLEKVEKAEDALFALGFADFRVRVAADGAARLQFPVSLLPEVMTQRTAVLGAVSPYFDPVTLDLAGRG